jgi:hypothetical protein
MRNAEFDKRKIDPKLKKDKKMPHAPRAIGLNRKPFQIRIQTNYE